jgi:hypothetical protein
MATGGINDHDLLTSLCLQESLETYRHEGGYGRENYSKFTLIEAHKTPITI